MAAARLKRQEADSFAWFCDPPEVTQLMQESERASGMNTPPLSQIPFLGGLANNDKNKEVASRCQIKATDSDYTRMAKSGGRPDLLSYKEPQGSKDAIEYAKSVDWYAHKEHEKTKTKVQMVLPDYMSHQEFIPPKPDSEPRQVTPQPSPFPLDDNLSIFQRDGNSNVRDKTIALPQPKYKSKRTKEKIDEFQAKEITRSLRPVRNVVWNGETS